MTLLIYIYMRFAQNFHACMGINIGWQLEFKKKFASTCRLFYFKAPFNEQTLGIYNTKRTNPAIYLSSCRAYYMYMLEHLQHRKL